MKMQKRKELAEEIQQKNEKIKQKFGMSLKRAMSPRKRTIFNTDSFNLKVHRERMSIKFPKGNNEDMQNSNGSPGDTKQGSPL